MTGARTRVLLASPRPPPVGGIATWTESVLASSLARDFDLRCVSTAPRDASDRPSESRFRLGRALRAVALVVRFVAECVRFRPAIVHVNTSYHWALARDGLFVWIARALGARPLLHLRGGDFGRFVDGLSAPARRLAWLALRGAERVIVLDEATRAYVARELGPRRVVRLQSFVALPAPEPAAPHAGAPDPAPGADSLRVVFVGAVIEAKGVLELLAALESVPRATLELVGPPDEALRPRLEAAIARLGGRARLLGPLGPAGVARALRAADVFVLPSHREGLPIALLEGMAAGLAIVATPVGGIPEAVREGEEALLVPVGDVALLARALGSLAADPALRRALATRAQARWRDAFSPEAGLARLRALWSEVARG